MEIPRTPAPSRAVAPEVTMSSFRRPLPAFILAVSVGAGATAPKPSGPATPETVHAAQLEQQQLVITRDLRQQQRVDGVGHKLLAAATPFCRGALAPDAGMRLANIHSFPSTYDVAARGLGFSDTLIVVSVASGSAAARAGIAVGDRV